MRKLTTEEFIEKAKKIHGNKYNYSEVKYINCITTILITCKKHGVFPQTPFSHLQGHGCPKCVGNNKKTTEKFIEDAKKVHGDKYDYSKVEYINNGTKVIIICKEHGEFPQTPHAHLHGQQGCSKCAGKYKPTTEEFIYKAKKVHGDKYNYSKVNYISIHKKIIIICPVHGEFPQEPNNHLGGHGCQKCAGNNKKTTEEFIKDAKKVHGDKYDYSKVEYAGDGEKITIICPKHGEFTQIANKHLIGNNCSKCNSKISIISQKWLDMCGVPKDCREITIRCGRKRYIVDGYIEQTNTIYEFNGDFWHGNPKVFDPNEINPITKKSYGELYKKTIDKKNLFEKNGYKVIDIWESDFQENGEIR